MATIAAIVVTVGVVSMMAYRRIRASGVASPGGSLALQHYTPKHGASHPGFSVEVGSVPDGLHDAGPKVSGLELPNQQRWDDFCLLIAPQPAADLGAAE